MSNEARLQRLGIAHLSHEQQMEYLRNMNAETDRKEAEARAARDQKRAAQKKA